MKKTIICILGRTSAGKSALAKKMAEKFGLKIVQSYTTRQPRGAERKMGLENSDHIFISDSEFDALKEEDIAAKTTINGVRYCTTVDVLEKSDIYVIDPKGVKYLTEKFGDRFNIVQFYVYADNAVRELRYDARGSLSDFENRNDAENSQFQEYEKNHGYDILIYNNGNLDDTVDVMASYVELIIPQPQSTPETQEKCDKATLDIEEKCDESMPDVEEKCDTSAVNVEENCTTSELEEDKEDVESEEDEKDNANVENQEGIVEDSVEEAPFSKFDFSDMLDEDQSESQSEGNPEYQSEELSSNKNEASADPFALDDDEVEDETESEDKDDDDGDFIIVD